MKYMCTPANNLPSKQMSVEGLINFPVNRMKSIGGALEFNSAGTRMSFLCLMTTPGLLMKYPLQ